MVYQMCSIFDMVAMQYGTPFFAVNTASAVRSLAQEVNTPSASNLYRNPQDFQLFHIGSFDDERCVVSLLDDRDCLVRCSDLVDQRLAARINPRPDDIGVADSPEPAVGA